MLYVYFIQYHQMGSVCLSVTCEWVCISAAVSTWRMSGQRAISWFVFCALCGFKARLLHGRCRRGGGHRSFGLEIQKMSTFYVIVCTACVSASTCGVGGLSIWGLRICKASSRGVVFFLNFPSGLLNKSIQYYFCFTTNTFRIYLQF